MIFICFVCLPGLVIITLLLGQLFFQRRYKNLLPELQRTLPDGKPVLIVGFFHPYCNAGGGGERVLWTAIRALQNRYSHVKCVIYTGDTDASREEILMKATQRFNISLPRTGASDLQFVFLNRRYWVEARPYPVLTLLGQSLGSIVLGLEALLKFIPDVYIDTMGYAFTLPLFRYIGGCKVACYVHYPTISTDMLERVASRSSSYNNASTISRSVILSQLKLLYYKLFAFMYGLAGRCSNVVMVNSTWTYGHICYIWRAHDKTHIVYPPCDINEFLSIPFGPDAERKQHNIISIGQFRPEKDHPLQIKSFSKFLQGISDDEKKCYKLILVGGCRNKEDEERVANLKKLCQDLNIQDSVEFKLNISFTELKKCLEEATVGLHTMWNEHFGIGVVECMAGGTVVLAHNSGGPKLDIVKDYQNHRTGFLADDVESYSKRIGEILDMSPDERLQIKKSARESVRRFSEEEFEAGFISATENLFNKVKAINPVTASDCPNKTK